MKEETALPPKEVPVHSRRSASLEVPRTIPIMRKVRTCVMQLKISQDAQGIHNVHKKLNNTWSADGIEVNRRNTTNIGDHNEPMRYEKPRYAIVLEHSPPAKEHACLRSEHDHGEDTQVRRNHSTCLGGLKKDRIRYSCQYDMSFIPSLFKGEWSTYD